MEWQEIYNRSHELLREGRYEAACELLREAADDSRSGGNKADAAFFSNALGSAYVAQKRDREALEAYLQAEMDDPSDVQLPLATAWHLGFAMGSWEEARRKVADVSPRIDDGLTKIKATVILGAAALQMGEDELAVNLFNQLVALSEMTPARNRDLVFVERLLKSGLALPKCSAYLTSARNRAVQDGDDVILRQIDKIQERNS